MSGSRALRCASFVVIGCILVAGLAGCQVLFEPTDPPTTWVPLPTVGSTETPPPPTSAPAQTHTPEVVAATSTPVPTRLAQTHNPEDGAIWGRDQAWTYLRKHNPDPRQPHDPTWDGPSIQGMIGATKYSYAAGDWIATIAVPLVAPEKIVYDVHLSGPGGYAWQAQVFPDGHIAADEPVTGPTPEPIEGLQGTLYAPEDAAAEGAIFFLASGDGLDVVIASHDADVQATIEALIDTGEIVAVWGALIREGDAPEDARVLASSVSVAETPTPASDATAKPMAKPTNTRAVAPTPRPTSAPKTEIVEGWVGVVRSLPRTSEYDDYFDGQQPKQSYGIQGAMAPIEEQLANASATGVLIRVYGVLELGADDYGGGRIVVSHIERL